MLKVSMPLDGSCFSLQPFGHPTAGASLSQCEKGRRARDKSGNRKGALPPLCREIRPPQWLPMSDCTKPFAQRLPLGEGIDPTDKRMGLDNFKFRRIELFQVTRGVSLARR
ncbi:hypothetical protein PQG02_10185 [Nostoc sp. UHCC 0926]|uniref:hypothetical protein n=1 Tax=Nostoc sp. TaxID=1180 RepID=UPI0027A223C1|nr:hypothetical protein PQG02_10185 [Nostoc sp. UHCC 0926]